MNALGWIKLDILVDKPNFSNDEAVRELASVARALRNVATTAAELDWMARYVAFRGDLDESLKWEKRAMEADPSCVPCLRAAAEFASRKGAHVEALTIARMALALTPDGNRSEGLVAQIARYRRAVEKSTPSHGAARGSAR